MFNVTNTRVAGCHALALHMFDKRISGERANLVAANELQHGGHGIGAISLDPGLLCLDVCEVLLQLLFERLWVGARLHPQQQHNMSFHC